METEHFAEEQPHKKGRHRKKQLYNSILQQMEFYFSDSNLTKDRFLSELISNDPFVDISTFLKCNKIRKLTTNVKDIAKAVSKSELLELSEDQTKIQRKLPIQTKENVDECTIYVERLKSDATHEWLSSIFSEFGNVVYVSIPKYKHNGMIKGFAFVEFENEEGAREALERFEEIDCKIPSHVEPEQLCSIATYEGDNKNINQISEALMESNDDRMEMNEKLNKKKRKHLDDNDFVEDLSENSNGEIKRKRQHSSEIIESELPLKQKEEQDNKDDIQEEVMEVMVGTEAEDVKKKRKLKKALRKKANLKEIGLQILSKKDWKKMRNRYLDMQRKTMKQLKMHLNRQRFNKRYESNKNSQTTFKKDTVNAADSAQVNSEKAEDNEYDPGTIVKIALLEPCEENKKLKTEIKNYSSEIKFVDIPQQCGSQEIFVRFSDSKNAQMFCTSNFSKGKLSILDGDEEKDYWRRIEDARQSKQKRSTTKQRGRDKLLKKAGKQVATHVRFDNDSE